VNSCYLLYQEIYLKREQITSTEWCNSFPCLLWEPARQNYLAAMSVLACVLSSCEKVVRTQPNAEQRGNSTCVCNLLRIY